MLTTPNNNFSNSQNKNSIANVVLSNLDPLTENTLAYYINSNLCLNAKLALSNKNIHIYILDLDRKYDPNIVTNTETAQQYIIGIYMKEKKHQESNHMILVQKPLNVTELKDAIDKVHSQIFTVTESPPKNISQKLKPKVKHKDQIHRNLYNAVDDENIEDDIHLRYKAQRYVGNNQDVNPKQDNLNHIYYTEDNYFYHHLIKAINIAKTNKSNTIVKNSLGNIIYQYKEKIVSHDISENKLKLLLTVPLISPVSIGLTQPIHLQREYNINASSFIWDACIRTSKGRLPEFTNLTNPVSMSVWPNFSQFKIFRHAIQIAAVWSRQRVSLADTAKLLKIPQRYVFSLYAAMSTLGYAEILETQDVPSNDIVDNNKPAQKPSKLFSKILSHIFKRN